MKLYDVAPGFEFDERTDLQQSPAWFLDATHSLPPWTPMFGWYWVNFCRHGMQYGAEKLSLPRVKGWDWRLKNGGGYLALLLVKSEEERRQREARFQQAMEPFFQDFDGLWKGFIHEIMARYRQIKALDPDRANNITLLDNFEQVLDVARRCWEIHMYMMYGVYTGFLLFEKMCKEHLGIDDSWPQFHLLVSGFDNKIFQVDRRLWEFARRAQKDGLDRIILNHPLEEIWSLLQASPQGQAFVREFRSFLQEDGWRMQRMAEINQPTWLEDPRPAMAGVRPFLRKGGDFDLDRERQRLEQKRLQTQDKLLARIGDQHRPRFLRLLELAQKSGVFSEEHSHYLELYAHALLRRTCLGLGRRFALGGAVDQAEDIFFLIPDEVRRAALSPEQFDLRHLVRRRREQWEQWKKTPHPPAILREGFDLVRAMKLVIRSNDPIALKVVVGRFPRPRPELKADLYGTCGSPGVAEGRARVVLNEDQLSELRQGEILVAVNTSPTWTLVFPLLKGVVVDRGASLSHAAIVGREYGIPVVMNVLEGTQVIQTGQLLRVDADQGAVYILDK